jgi:hypothetical protein
MDFFRQLMAAIHVSLAEAVTRGFLAWNHTPSVPA